VHDLAGAETLLDAMNSKIAGMLRRGCVTCSCGPVTRLLRHGIARQVARNRRRVMSEGEDRSAPEAAARGRPRAIAASRRTGAASRDAERLLTGGRLENISHPRSNDVMSCAAS
jgi:hypothetical protein